MATTTAPAAVDPQKLAVDLLTITADPDLMPDDADLRRALIVATRVVAGTADITRLVTDITEDYRAGLWDGVPMDAQRDLRVALLRLLTAMEGQ